MSPAASLRPQPSRAKDFGVQSRAMRHGIAGIPGNDGN
jgi:hypothetical protein